VVLVVLVVLVVVAEGSVVVEVVGASVVVVVGGSVVEVVGASVVVVVGCSVVEVVEVVDVVLPPTASAHLHVSPSAQSAEVAQPMLLTHTPRSPHERGCKQAAPAEQS